MTHAGARPGALAIQPVEEREVLPQTDLAALRSFGEASGPGAWAEAAPACPGDEAEVRAKLDARSGGPVRPLRQEIWISRPTAVCRVRDVHHLPGFGAVIDGEGRAFRSTIGEVMIYPRHLATAPGFEAREGGFAFTPPVDAPTLASACVFMAWGGNFNYGHFVLDCLSSLQALVEAGLVGQAPLIAPPLNGWRREFLRLGFGDVPVTELKAPVVRVEQAAFATSMDHFLHGPNALLEGLRRRVLSRTPRSRRQARRIYLSRRSQAHTMRIMVNEAELEAALETRGFTVVRPERLSVQAQVDLMRQAEVVIGPTGAAMANVLFTEPGAKVFEIQPETFASAWVPALCDVIGREWFVFYSPAPLDRSDVPFSRRVRRGFQFGYRLPLHQFLAFVDERL